MFQPLPEQDDRTQQNPVATDRVPTTRTRLKGPLSDTATVEGCKPQKSNVHLAGGPVQHADERWPAKLEEDAARQKVTEEAAQKQKEREEMERAKQEIKVQRQKQSQAVLEQQRAEAKAEKKDAAQAASVRRTGP